MDVSYSLSSYLSGMESNASPKPRSLLQISLASHKGTIGPFPAGSDGEESVCNAGDLGSISGLGRSPGEGYGSPLQCSCLENSIDRGAWQATVHGVAERQTRLSH